MSHAVSPLAPKHVPDMPEIAGVRVATGAAGITYKDRTDVLLALAIGVVIIGAVSYLVFRQSRPDETKNT